MPWTFFLSYFNYTAWHDVSPVIPCSAQLLCCQVLLVLPHPKRVQTPPKQLVEPVSLLCIGWMWVTWSLQKRWRLLNNARGTETVWTVVEASGHCVVSRNHEEDHAHSRTFNNWRQCFATRCDGTRLPAVLSLAKGGKTHCSAGKLPLAEPYLPCRMVVIIIDIRDSSFDTCSTGHSITASVSSIHYGDHWTGAGRRTH